MKFKITHHRNPAERTLLEKIVRRFILPPHGPFSLQIGRWQDRDKRLKKAFPIRFFIWDTVPDWYRGEITARYRNVKNWIRFRTWDKYHVLKLELEPNYHDPDTRLLHSNFQILKDYVEFELAAMMSENDDDTKEDKGVGPFLAGFTRRYRKARRKNIRRPDLGLKHLDWEISETQGHQKDSAEEQKAIYLWWTETRPYRLEPYNCPHLDEDYEDDGTISSIFNRPYNRKRHEARAALEKFYADEDEEMLIRLIKIRQSLWT